MIRTVRISGFKRFGEVEFRLPGHVVLAGPNNTGKTTVLQAIASWSLALRRWRELNDYSSRRGYARAPITRQAFAAVPLRNFDLMWKDRRYGGRIEIEIRHDAGWSVTMELIADSTEQIYVRPKAEVPEETLRELDLGVVYVPPMTGLETNERLLQPAAVEQISGSAVPARSCAICSSGPARTMARGPSSRIPSGSSSAMSCCPRMRAYRTSKRSTERRMGAGLSTSPARAADSSRC